MNRRKLLPWCLAVFCTPLLSGWVAQAGDIQSATSWVSRDAVVVLVLNRPADWIAQWQKSPVRPAVENHPVVQQALNNPGVRQFEALVGMVELHTKLDRWELLKKLTGGGILVAAMPGNKALMIMEAEDPEVLRQVHEFLLGLTRLDAQQKGQPDRVRSAEYRGVVGWSFGNNDVHAIIGRRLVWANKPEVLKEVIDRSLDGPAGSLTENPKFTAAITEVSDENLQAYLDLEVLRALPNVSKGLEQSQEPIPLLLVAATVASLQQAPWLAAGLNVEGNRITGKIRTGEVADWPESLSFAAVPSDQGALVPLKVPGTLTSLTLYRNLRDFYAQKNELFPERTSALIFFENMMGIFFTGRNFTEEVLGELEPHVRLVVATQRYSPEVGVPAIQLPAFALVFRMKDPEKFRPVIEEGFQKALGLINFVRGQDAQPGLILDRPEYNGVKYTLAYFNPDPEGDKTKADIRFNFSPVLACRGKDAVLSTAEPLAKDILDALAAQESLAEKVQKSVSTHLEVLGAQIAKLLELNKEALIAQNMAEKGHSREAAEREISQLMSLLNMLESLQLTEYFRNNSTQWDFQLRLNP